MKHRILLHLPVKLGITCLVLNSVACKKTSESTESHTKRASSKQDQTKRPAIPRYSAKYRNTQRDPSRLVQVKDSQYGNKLPFAEKAQIDLGIDLSKETLSHPALRGPSLSSLPIWKREKVREVRAELYNIYDGADKQATKIKDKSAYERSQWKKEWNKVNQRKLRALKAKERDTIEERFSSKPSDAEIKAFRQKISSKDPIFEEADLIIIENLLYPLEELTSLKSAENKQVQDLIIMHNMLSEIFPQSVGRKELKHLYR